MSHTYLEVRCQMPTLSWSEGGIKGVGLEEVNRYLLYVMLFTGCLACLQNTFLSAKMQY